MRHAATALMGAGHGHRLHFHAHSPIHRAPAHFKLLALFRAGSDEAFRVIHDRYEGMSKTYQRIAVYLTQNPNDVAVLSVNAIAERVTMRSTVRR